MRDFIWLLMTVILLCSGFTHLAAWMFGVFCAGMWVGLCVSLAEGTRR